jgi:hypothetical protein
MYVSSDNPLENGNGSLWTDLPSLRRTLVFGLLGPLLGIFELLSYEAAFGGFGSLLPIIMGVVFVFGLLASAVTGIMDGILFRTLPISLRAPLAALSGAMLAIGPTAASLGPMSLGESMAVAAVGALNMAVCAWVTHNDRDSKTRLGATNSPLS